MRMFEGKVALVTGASSGIGEATALEFARQGANVAIAARRVEKCEQVVHRIAELGGEALFVQTDVTKAAELEALVEAVLARFSRLDCAVNNAGIGGSVFTPAADITEETWDMVMNTNLKAVWMGMKYQIPAILRSGGGAIVNVASIYGAKGSDLGHAQYAASKFGVIGLTQSAAIDYGRSGIRINAVAPGFTHSELVTPHVEAAPEFMNSVIQRHSSMGRLGNPEETAQVITWLCSDGARFVNGAVVPVDGGSTARLY